MMNQDHRRNSVARILRRVGVGLVVVALLCVVLPFGASPVRAESFDVTMNCPNNVSYSFTNDTNTLNQYYITVADSQGNGLGSTAYSAFLKPGETLPKDGEANPSLDLVRVPAAGDLTVTLWRVTADGEVSSVSSLALENCWPPSLSAPASAPTATGVAGTPATSRIHATCTATAIDLSLTDAQYDILSIGGTFDDQALLAAGADGIYQMLPDGGVLSVAGSQGWDGMYYYAAWNGGGYAATGQHDFSLTFQCSR